MRRMLFLIYGLIIVIGSTMTNLAYTKDNSGSYRSWGSGSGGSYSSGGGGWHSSGGHK